MAYIFVKFQDFAHSRQSNRSGTFRRIVHPSGRLRIVPARSASTVTPRARERGRRYGRAGFGASRSGTIVALPGALLPFPLPRWTRLPLALPLAGRTRAELFRALHPGNESFRPGTIVARFRAHCSGRLASLIVPVGILPARLVCRLIERSDRQNKETIIFAQYIIESGRLILIRHRKGFGNLATQ